MPMILLILLFLMKRKQHIFKNFLYVLVYHFRFPWNKLKPLMMKKVDLAMREFQDATSMDKLAPLPNVENVDYECLSRRVLERLDDFTGSELRS